MTTEASTVIVVDDDASVCSSIKRLLRASGFNVSVYANAAHLAGNGRPAVPSCLILDVEMPDVNGIEFAESLNRTGIRIPTIFLTGVGDIPMSVHAIKGGAIDFLTKPFDVDELLVAVGRALEADVKLLAEERRAAELRQRFDTLTLREQEVFFAVTSGLLNKQAAMKLGVSEKTIKAHRGRVTEKMGAESVAELVRMADSLQRVELVLSTPVVCDALYA